MRCPACERDNLDDARFCAYCGTTLGPVSLRQIEPLRGFVPAELAQKILAAGGAGERRTVTALFCDLVGSTALGERLGPERFKVVMDQILGRIISAVSQYEGTIAQILGDGLLAFFGAPLAHEDDPERAVRAAIDIRDAIAVFSEELDKAYSVSLRVRVGLNTGPVVLSRITNMLEVAYNALGDTVTTASRLQNAAQPGTILASETTARLVESLFEVRPVEPLSLKGKNAPVAAVEVLERRDIVGKARGIAGLSAPLVGRDHELAQMRGTVSALTEGRGQIVAIVGEPGIGKSRLVAEVQRSSPQMRWLEGRCLSYAGSIPYFPFLDLMREWLSLSSSASDVKTRIELRAALGRLFTNRADEVYPYFGAMLRLALEPEALATISDLSAESLQHQTFKVIGEWAARFAREQPLGMILDDLNWADSTSLTLLEELLEVTEQAPLLLCLLFRPERNHGCWRLKNLAAQQFPHRYVEIVLQPLGADAAELLAKNLLAHSDIPANIRDLILQKAEGNPFFVEEIIRVLIEAGILVKEGDRWRPARQIVGLEVPNTIQGVILSRIDRLPEDARRILQTASIIGRLFPLEILKEALRLDGGVTAAIAELQRRDLIVERRRIPEAEYRFKHALTQEVVYGTLAQGERRRLHGEVARALESRYASRIEEVYGMLAYHYDQSQDEQRALEFLVLAGDKSRAEYAHEEALRHYARAVEFMKQRGLWHEAAQTLMKTALAHHIASNFSAANVAFQEAFEIIDRTPSPASPPVAHDILRQAANEPVSLDNTQAYDSSSAFLMSQVFEGLLQYAPGWNVAPALARSWTISNDGTRYVLHLRRDRRWSDGRPVTANDFIFTWLRGMRGIYSHIFHDIVGAKAYSEGKTEDTRAVGVRALDDYALEVRLEGPRAYFPFVLAHYSTFPQPRWVIEAHGDEWATPERLVCNGPYVLAEWQRGDHLRLVANTAYTGPRKGNVKEVRWFFRLVGDPAPFAAGEVDVQGALGLIVERIATLRDRLHLGPVTFSAGIFFRCDRPPFHDRRLRRAFAHATDHQALARRMSRAYVTAADGGFVPPALPGHSPQIGVPFDPAAARELLREAGYPDGGRLGPIGMTVAETFGVPCEYLSQAWREILGAAVTVTRIPWRDYNLKIRASPPPIGSLGWTPDYPDPDCFLRLPFHSTSGASQGGWKNSKFDSLVEQAQAATDQRRRMALYHEADRLLVTEEAAFIPIVYGRSPQLVQSHVQGWWSNIFGSVRIADVTIERKHP